MNSIRVNFYMITITILYFYIILYGLIGINFRFNWLKCNYFSIIQVGIQVLYLLKKKKNTSAVIHIPPVKNIHTSYILTIKAKIQNHPPFPLMKVI